MLPWNFNKKNVNGMGKDSFANVAWYVALLFRILIMNTHVFEILSNLVAGWLNKILFYKRSLGLHHILYYFDY